MVHCSTASNIGRAVKNPLKTFQPNEAGRDFVIGDLHGSLACFNKLLEGIGFDKAKDRMFSVGDLVDRGPNSLECLALIKEPWFHCVLANHEQMMLEAFDGGYMGQFWVQNGGYWGHTAYQDFVKSKAYVANELDRHVPDPASTQLFELLPFVRELPYLITVHMPAGNKFHLIHAELPPGQSIPITDATLADPENVRRLATIQAPDGDFLLWGRFMFGQFYKMNVSNFEKVKRIVAYKFRESFGWFNEKLSHIISGHTIMQHPMTIIGQTNIDTGAYGSNDRDAAKWESLTCIELKTWTFYQATPYLFRTVTPLTVNRDDVLKVRSDLSNPLRSSLNDVD